MSALDTWLTIAQMIAPSILAAIPNGAKIAPFVPVITSGIQAAEQLPGATSDQKKSHVMTLAMAAFQTLEGTGVLHLNPAEFQSTVGAGIDATVGTINLVQQAHQAGSAGVLLPPPAGVTHP
jgi:hypothetical protein